MKRTLAFTYGVACYGVFLGTFLYTIGFIGNIAVPKSIDSPRDGTFLAALAINSALLGLFTLQHSVMARPAFKRWWTRWIPRPVERSTYVLMSSLALMLLFWQWRPMGGVLWNVESTGGRIALASLFVFGWLLIVVSTFLIDHFDLFGLRQLWLHLKRRRYTPLRFATPGPYRAIRHPLYLGWLFTFWAAPTMTVAHLFFAVLTTVYILVAIRLEERNLIQFHGDAYAEYRRRVPMLFPRPGRKTSRKRPPVGARATTA